VGRAGPGLDVAAGQARARRARQQPWAPKRPRARNLPARPSCHRRPARPGGVRRRAADAAGEDQPGPW